MRKPIICAIAGYAVGEGLEISLVADMWVIDENPTSGVFSRQVGVPMIEDGAVRLQTLVGLGKAIDWIVTTRSIQAQEALSSGLANRVVPQRMAFQEATNIATYIITLPQSALNTDRHAAYHAAYEVTSFGDALSREFKEGFKVDGSESKKCGLKFSLGSGRREQL